MTTNPRNLFRKVVSRLRALAGRPNVADPACEGFDLYLARARAAGCDVNDWLESELGWEPARPLLERIVFPLLRDDPQILEIGSGTGRHARHFAPRLGRGRFLCVDHSAWCRDFLARYFGSDERFGVATLVDGRLPVPDAATDLVFSNGTFIELKLGRIAAFAAEAGRVLRPGGVAVFDYLDSGREEPWKFLRETGPALADCFTYHSADAIDRSFREAGLSPVDRHHEGKGTYAVFRKGERPSA